MAQRGNGKGNSNGKGFENGGEFADVKLTTQEAEAFRVWASDKSVDWLDCFTLLIEDSYRVSLKYDYHNSCLVCTLTQQDNKHRNHGLIVMSRSDNVEETVLLSFYKTMVLYGKDRLPTAHDSNTWG